MPDLTDMDAKQKKLLFVWNTTDAEKRIPLPRLRHTTAAFPSEEKQRKIKLGNKKHRFRQELLLLEPVIFRL